jgi:GAF domain-containing protein
LDTLVNTAARLCSADFGHLSRRDGEVYRAAASFAFSDEWAAFIRRQTWTAGGGSVVGRSLLEARAVHIADITADPEYAVPEAITIGKIRTLLGVPLLRENEPIGVFAFGRNRVEPFTERQIALVSTFADQAVIAIENTRLFNELRQRTHDLQESLEYQTASSDVLKVISRSGAELGPVLDTLVETAARICRADSGFIFRLHDGLCRMVASFGIPAEYRDFQTRNPIAPSRGTLAGRTVLERRAVHIEDAATDPEYTRAEAVQLGRQRTMLGLPLVREDALIGGTQQHDACRRVSVGAGERLGQCHLQLAADRVQFLRPVARFYAIEISEFGKSPSPRD